jgi:hypothetical protein
LKFEFDLKKKPQIERNTRPLADSEPGDALKGHRDNSWRCFKGTVGWDVKTTAEPQMPCTLRCRLSSPEANGVNSADKLFRVWSEILKQGKDPFKGHDTPPK